MSDLPATEAWERRNTMVTALNSRAHSMHDELLARIAELEVENEELRLDLADVLKRRELTKAARTGCWT